MRLCVVQDSLHVFARMCVCLYLCVCVFVCAWYLCLCVCECERLGVCVRGLLCVRVCVRMCMCVACHVCAWAHVREGDVCRFRFGICPFGNFAADACARGCFSVLISGGLEVRVYVLCTRLASAWLRV